MSETQKPISGTPHRDKSDEGYRKGLKSRHMRMIALGGAIGSGLFYGASGRIADGGPSVAIVYAICGGIAYLMLRALGELSLYRPSRSRVYGRAGRLFHRMVCLYYLFFCFNGGYHRNR